VSRAGLVLHEIAGHGGVAAALGCRLTELRLFLFGGGWVSYDCAELTRAGDLAIDLGGIALELLASAALLALARGRRGVPGLLAAAGGLLFALHALFYLVTGVHYGAGDGRGLHALLGPGPGRAALVAAGSAVLVAATFLAAQRLATRIGVWVPAQRPVARAALVAGAVLAAAALHGALLLAEQRWRADPVYAATFQPEHERAIAAQLERFTQAPRTAAEIAARRRALEARHAPFPLTPVLGAAMTLAALAGVVRSTRSAPPGPAEAVRLGPAAAACALALAAALAIDRAL
jgi:hypothetical protein